MGSPAGQRGIARRRGALIGAGVVLVVVLAVVVATHLLGLGGTKTPAVPAAPTGTHTPGTAITCPDDIASFGEIESSSPVSLPRGAVSLRWCTFPGDPFLSEYAPPDQLTQGLDAWVDAFNALKTFPRNAACTGDWSTPGMAALVYADGSVRRVSGMRAGCGLIGGRMGFSLMRDLTIKALQAQRGDTVPAAVDPAKPPLGFAPCSSQQSTIPARLEWVTEAVTCTRDDQGKGHVATVSSDAVPAIVDDLRAHRTKASVSTYGEGPGLFLRQANGEFLRLDFSQRAGLWVMNDGTTAWTWAPDPTSRKAIAAATSEPTGSTSTPSEGTTAACSSSSATVATTLPADATAVWFCSDWRFGPGEPLTRGMSTFLASLAGTSTTCVPNRADEWFVATRPDGTSTKLLMPVGECHPQQRAVETFVTLMRGQRDPASGWRTPTVQPPRKLCLWDTWETLMPVTPGEAEQIRYCNLSRKANLTDEDVAGIPLADEGSLPDSERQTIQLDLMDHSTPAGSLASGEVVLALLRTNGELLWVRKVDGQEHQLTWKDASGRAMVWTPDAQSQAILDAYARR